MVRWAVARIKNFASELFRVKSRVLRGATVDVHTLRPVPAPEEFEPEDDTQPVMLEWFEIDATIFPAPNAASPMNDWDIDDLRLVPIDEPDRSRRVSAGIDRVASRRRDLMGRLAEGVGAPEPRKKRR